RLDAFPQFWNVLRGEMSIVGPDADRPEFAAWLDQAIPFHIQRTTVKPGMTGWAQIHEMPRDLPTPQAPRVKPGAMIADSNTDSILLHDAVRRLEYVLYYIKNLSPSLDFSVMLRWLRRALV